MNTTLRDRILSLNQELIFSIYFDLSISDINWSTISNYNRLSNPFREDDNPSLSFKWYAGKLIVRDWGDSRYSGDVFKVIGYILNRNCYVNTQFIEICEDILVKYYNFKTPDNDEYKILSKEKDIHNIEYKTRILQKRDYNYFNKYGITNKSVDLNVEAVSRYSMNGIVTGYRNSFNDPCYKYIINRDFVKLYFPNRHKQSIYPRFITNNILFIEDITELQQCNDIIICKSIKDKLLLNQFLDILKITDIKIHTSNSESPTIQYDIISLLNKYSIYNVYSMFDNDSVGLQNMKVLEEEYNIKPLIFSTNPNAKDPTDFYKEFGYDKTLNSFKHIIQLIKNNRNETRCE